MTCIVTPDGLGVSIVWLTLITLWVLYVTSSTGGKCAIRSNYFASKTVLSWVCNAINTCWIFIILSLDIVVNNLSMGHKTNIPCGRSSPTPPTKKYLTSQLFPLEEPQAHPLLNTCSSLSSRSSNKLIVGPQSRPVKSERPRGACFVLSAERSPYLTQGKTQLSWLVRVRDTFNNKIVTVS